MRVRSLLRGILPTTVVLFSMVYFAGCSEAVSFDIADRAATVAADQNAGNSRVAQSVAANDDERTPAIKPDKTGRTSSLRAGAGVKPGSLAAPGPSSWPSFRNGNLQQGVATGRLPKKLKLLWKHKTRDGVEATAAIVGRSVYVGALSGYLYCFDRQTGKVMWKYRSIENLDPEQFSPGFKAAPRVTADAIYIGDEDGMIHAVDRVTGRKKWIVTTGAEIAGCAAIVGKHVIVGSYDSFLYCLNIKDGSIVWKFQTGDRINGSPAIAGKYTFVAGCDQHLRVINIETGRQKGELALDTYLIASPAVMGEMLYVGTYGGRVVAVDWKNEKIVWKHKPPRGEFPIHSSAAVTDNYVVVGSRDKQLHCLDRRTGKSLWTFRTRGRIDSSPVIAGDRVYFGSADRRLYAVGLADGKQLWIFNASRSISAGPAVGEGCLVVGSQGSGGFIYCFGK